MGRQIVTTAGVIDEVVAAEEKAETDEFAADKEETTSGDPEVIEAEACGSTQDPTEGPAAGGGPASAGTFIQVASLQGAELRFGRDAGPPHAQSFPVEPDFKGVLERTVRLVVSRAPEEFGRLKSITSAGMMVVKPGMHGKGRACDWDAWTFSNIEIAPIRREHASTSRPVRQRYWALAALCRSSSSFVLHGEFNAAHEDHIHQDNGGGSIAFQSGSPSTVKLAQAVCNEIFEQSPKLRIDGDFGSKTREALQAALQRLHLDGDVDDVDVWRRFLRRSGRLGFKISL